MVLHHVGLAAAPSPPWYQLRLPEELLQTKLTMDEIAAIAVAATTLLSVLLMLLHGMFLWVIRLPCLQSWLLAMEVNAEVAAMNQSVQYAFATAMRDPIDAALESATPGGPPTSAAGFANRGRHRGAASVNDYAPVLILAEAKANSSAADDRRKTQPAMAVEIHKPAMKGRRGRAGALVDKRGRATLVYPGDGVYEGEYRDGKKEGKGKFWCARARRLRHGPAAASAMATATAARRRHRSRSGVAQPLRTHRTRPVAAHRAAGMWRGRCMRAHGRMT